MMKAVAKLGIIVLISSAVISAFILASVQSQQDQYVRGYYGKYCYQIRNFPPTIRHFLYFSSYEDCLKSIARYSK